MYKNDSVNKVVFYFITFIIFALCIGIMLLTFNNKSKVDKRKDEIEDLNGLSAYEVAKENGFDGTLEEYLASIKGEKGIRGKSAYELAKEEGFTGDIETWISLMNGIKGVDGEDGKSSYEIALENGFDGTYEQYQLVVQKIANNDTVGKSGKDGEKGLEIIDVSISSKEMNGSISTIFTFTFNDGSKCRKRSFPNEKLTNIYNLRNTSFPVGLDNYYFVLEAEFNGSKEQEIIVSMKDCSVSGVDFDTPGDYNMELSYKGFSDTYNVTVQVDSKSSIYSVGLKEQYVELLDDEDDIYDLTLEGYYNYTESYKYTLKYGEDFYIENPDMIYKSYYEGKAAHACMCYVRVYSYSYQDGIYYKNKNSYSTYNVYFYDPSNLCIIGYSTNSFEKMIIKDKNKDEIPTENFFSEFSGIKAHYSDGTYKDYTLTDEDMRVNNIVGYDNPIYNDSTVDKVKNYYGNLKYYYYSGNNMYETSYGIDTFVIYLDTLSLNDILLSTNISVGNYYLSSTFLSRNHNNFNSSTYELYLKYDSNEKLLSLDVYQEAYIQLNYSIRTDGNTIYFSKYEKLENILECIDYTDIEEEIYGKNVWEYRTFNFNYQAEYTNESLSLSLPNIKIYDRVGYSLSFGFKRDLRMKNETSYLEDELINIEIYQYLYFGNESTYGNSYLRFDGTVGEAEEKFLAPGEKLIRNVDGVDLSQKGDTIIYIYIPEYGMARDWVYIIDADETNNIREMELDRDVFTYPIGSSLDDVFYDYFTSEETYCSIYSNNSSTNSYSPRYEREWFKDNETGELNRVYSEPGTYSCTIETGFCSCVCNTITICIVDTVNEDPSIEEIGKYVWDIREDLKRAPIFAIDSEYFEMTLYSNNSLKLDLYWLDVDWDSDAEEGYSVELELEYTIYLSYKMKSENMISLLFGGFEYDYQIVENNMLIYQEPDMDSLTEVISIYNEEVHGNYLEIEEFYVFEEGYFYYCYQEIRLTNDSDPEVWWREELPYYLIDRCEIIDDKTIYFKHMDAYMRVIEYYDELGDVKATITEPDIYIYG